MSYPRKSGPWEAADTALLAALFRARLPFALIGRRLGRTPKACRERCRWLGLAIPARAGDRRTGTRGGDVICRGTRHLGLRLGPLTVLAYGSLFCARGWGWLAWSRAAGTLYARVGPVALVWWRPR